MLMKIVIDIDENVFTRLFDNGIEDYAIVNDDLIESENEYGENARYTENDRGYLGGLLYAYEMFGKEYEEVNADGYSD